MEIRAGVGAYDLDGFLEENHRGTNGVAAADINAVVSQLPPECMTTCTTSIQISFLGNDKHGQLHNSAAILRDTNGFNWVEAFDKDSERPYFGIPPDLIDLVSQRTSSSAPLVDDE